MKRVAILAALPVLAAAPLFPGQGRAPIETGSANEVAAACASCHAAIAAEWRGSRHAQAFDNANFTAALEAAPRREWCLNCHAPLGTDLAEEGVTCAACHVRDGRVRGPRPVEAPHDVVADARFGDPDFCGGCHQFDALVRGAPPHEHGAPQQDTVGEWKAWTARTGASEDCVDCHGAHGVTGAHDADRVSEAIDTEVVALGEDRVRATLIARGVGHEVPTGDPFRELVLELCADEACDPPLARESYGQTFVQTRRSWRRTDDRRLRPGLPDVREVALPARAWRLWLVLADGALDLPPEEKRILVRQGVVASP